MTDHDRPQLTAALSGAALLLVLSIPSAAQEMKVQPAAMPEGPGSGSMAIYSNYCANISDRAEEARAGIRKQYLEDLEKRVEERAAALETKRAEIEKWMKRREDFLAGATKNLIDIYSAMRAEAAALQIAAMSNETAAAILLKLKPRKASSILNEIEPKKAALLATIIAGASKPPKTKSGS